MEPYDYFTAADFYDSDTWEALDWLLRIQLLGGVT